VISHSFRRGGWPGAVGFAAAIFVSACAPSRIALPSGAGNPFPDYARAYAEASEGCAAVRTITAEIGIAGRAAGTKLRGRVIAGLEDPGSMRLEGVSPFGGPIFIFVARGSTATLLLQRDNRVLADAPAAAILEALAGVALTPDDLRAVLAGCVSAGRAARDARAFGDRWLRVDLGSDVRVYLQRVGTRWRIEAGEVGGVRVEYRSFASDNAPSEVRLIATAGANGASSSDLQLALSQVERNQPIAAAAFAVAVPKDAVPMTLRELRESGLFGR
jgi:hypothetical protein